MIQVVKFMLAGAAFVSLIACGGSLTDDQRRRLREGMKKNEIKKISEARITDDAFAQGRAVAKAIGNLTTLSPPQKDSLEKVFPVHITWLRADRGAMGAVERQIVEAYAAGASQGEIGDNVQKLGTDSLLYTRPVTKELPDGSRRFVQALGVRISRKQIVLAMPD